MRAEYKLSIAAVLVSGLVSGCEYFEELESTLSGLANPLVVEAVFVGVEPISTSLLDDVDFDMEDFADGTALEVFLADATSADNLDNAPVSGAAVTLSSQANGTLEVPEAEGGQYSLAGTESDLTYADDEEVTLSIGIDGGESSVMVVSPAAAELNSIEGFHTVGEPLTIDLTGQDFDSMLVLVYNISSGEIAFSNEPTTIDEIYAFTHAGDGNLSVDIPGSVFAAADSWYAIGVAGLQAAGTNDFSDMNSLLSAFLAGKFVFDVLTTCNLDGMTAEELLNMDPDDPCYPG